MPINRREFILRSAGAAALWPFALRADSGREAQGFTTPFVHGVASGDPLPERVVIWSRISGTSDDSVAVQWEVATDREMRDTARYGQLTTHAGRDYTVKVDVDGLHPGRTYYYRFRAFGYTSPIGRTRTAPVGAAENLRLGVVSCANYPQGYFNVYRALALRGDIDAVLHLGDYLYEYANGDYGDGTALGRIPTPPHETLTLEDYRNRHGQYKLDPDLALLHRLQPFITVWDDHEVANDAWTGGAENHNPGEGDWFVRKAAAIQAYYEWMPIREGRMYRTLSWGTLADLILLDTRLEGRDQQVSQPADPARNDPQRTLLGAPQEDWFLERLNRSQADWRLVGQQVMFGQLKGLNVPDLQAAGIPVTEDMVSLNMDQWDGYPEARLRILEHIRARAIDNVVILTGDIHSSWAMEIYLDSGQPLNALPQPPLGLGPLAVEFVTPSVTSPGFPEPAADPLAQLIPTMNPHMKYVELKTHGYLLLDVRRERVQSEWWYVDNIASRNFRSWLGARVETRAGSNRVVVDNELATITLA